MIKILTYFRTKHEFYSFHFIFDSILKENVFCVIDLLFMEIHFEY
jgi:hypothetical protein